MSYKFVSDTYFSFEENQNEKRPWLWSCVWFWCVIPTPPHPLDTIFRGVTTVRTLHFSGVGAACAGSLPHAPSGSWCLQTDRALFKMLPTPFGKSWCIKALDPSDLFLGHATSLHVGLSGLSPAPRHWWRGTLLEMSWWEIGQQLSKVLHVCSPLDPVIPSVGIDPRKSLDNKHTRMLLW